MDKHLILGIHVTDRLENAPRVQQLFTEYGCHIKTRLGLHETGPEGCGPNGLVLLELRSPEGVANELAAKLNALKGVEVQKMVFDHPR
ncbi:MAG: hypothetical protein ACYDIE_01790 [Candidatus Krumholzibacteriia bacterium]